MNEWAKMPSHATVLLWQNLAPLCEPRIDEKCASDSLLNPRDTAFNSMTKMAPTTTIVNTEFPFPSIHSVITFKDRNS
jgi:hypothetical protein